MNNTTEKKIAPSTALSRIYKTDPFGFPIYAADEELYQQSQQKKGLNPDAASDTAVIAADAQAEEQSTEQERVVDLW